MKAGATLLVAVTLLTLATGSATGDGGRNHEQVQPFPIQLGTSGSSATDPRDNYGTGRCTAGTIGAAVSCNGELHVLSTNFTMAHQNATTPPPPAGDLWLQPGLADTNCRVTGNPVAAFVGDVVPLTAGVADTALALALPGAVDPSGAILDIGVPCSDPVVPAVGMPVLKSGRATGLTEGFIEVVDVTATVSYGGGLYPGVFQVIFDDLILIEKVRKPFSDAGDDGALVVTADANHHPVAVINYPGNAYAYADPFTNVVQAYSRHCGGRGLSLVGRQLCPAAVTSAVNMYGPSAVDVEQAGLVKARHAASLMADDAIIGVGVGAMERSAWQAAIVVLRDRGRPLARPITGTLDGVPVRVLETDPIVRR